MYIVSSSRNQVIKKILSEKLSLLFGNFEIVKISGFDIEMSKLFIETHLAGFEMDDSLKRFLIAFTDGNPFYLNHIVKKTKEISSDRMSNYIDTGIMGEAIIDLVYNANGIIHQYLMNFILDLIDTKHKDRHISILAAIANGKNRLPDIAKTLRSKQSEISKDLLQLSQIGFISKNGVFYLIDDSVLEFWLKNVYQKRKTILVDGILNRTELFNSEIRSYIDDFITKSQEAVPARLAELFNSFSNELVQIDSKQQRMPHFTKVEITLSKEDKKNITASFRGKAWVVQAYEEAVKENDIIDYIRNIKFGSHKVANKIIIPLKGIEENAKLLAKELKIAIWDISTLNGLLNIYGKKKVVI